MTLQRCKRFALALVVVAISQVQSARADVQFTPAGKLIRPLDYREWVLIGTGLNMSYGPLRETANSQPPFTNVFVNPKSYQTFLKSGVCRSNYIHSGNPPIGAIE